MAERIPFEGVEGSSSISAYGYDPDKRILAIFFKTARIWHYAGVPGDLVNAFELAESKGQFYNAYIKGQFVGKAMTGDCPDCGDHGWIGDTCQECGCGVYTAAVRPVRHWVMPDEPSATSKQAQRALCGIWTGPKHVAKQQPSVTCPDCRAALERYDAAEF